LEHFKAPKEQIWNRAIPTTEEGVCNRVFTKSYAAVLGDEEKAVLKDKLRSVLRLGEDRVWVDEANGVFEYPYKTRLIVMHKA
jgi:hypothetical protein